MKLIEYDSQINQAILNGIRHLTKENVKRTRKYSAAVWFDLDIALRMHRAQFENFFMEQAKKMMNEAWRAIQEIKKEERCLVE